ncbi:MAG: cytochrome c [Chromatiales bacterium]|nr:cytochrome c [Chromatiales bacterium]
MSMRTLFAALILAISGPAVAGDVQRGLEIGYTCMGCHGIEGQRNAFPSFRVPRLGGQHAEYIVLSLQGYRNGTRQHPTMEAQAATMTDQDMRDLAAYFASLGELRTGRPGRAAARGAEKAQVCAACHGQDGVSPSPMWPTLAGQHRDYLVETLKAYRDGRRTDPVMAAQAVGLSDRDIQDLAIFYASHPGLFTPRR